jgi:hypothetical protein
MPGTRADVKNEKQYGALKDTGRSKQRAACSPLRRTPPAMEARRRAPVAMPSKAGQRPSTKPRAARVAERARRRNRSQRARHATAEHDCAAPATVLVIALRGVRNSAPELGTLPAIR